MKQLHIVGKSEDNTRLFLAVTPDAKLGAFEVPITAELRELLEQGPEPDTVGEETLGPFTDIDIPIGRGDEANGEVEPDGQQEPLPETSESERAGDDGEPMRVRRKRPPLPATSRLTPAEIQTLIRAGRGVTSVARRAGAPVAWVRYLAGPIQEERMGIVARMLRVRQVRPRLGTSAEPIGTAVARNLRSRGVRDPDGVAARGFSAYRPAGRGWRVRLIYTHRGKRYTALWTFDPRSRKAVPANPLANSLGWRRPRAGGRSSSSPRTEKGRGGRRRATGGQVRRRGPRATPPRRPARKRGEPAVQVRMARKPASKRTAALKRRTSTPSGRARRRAKPGEARAGARR